jgi:hypothetical protein
MEERRADMGADRTGPLGRLEADAGSVTVWQAVCACLDRLGECNLQQRREPLQVTRERASLGFLHAGIVW